jgi:hypothetical protein
MLSQPSGNESNSFIGRPSQWEKAWCGHHSPFSFFLHLFLSQRERPVAGFRLSLLLPPSVCVLPVPPARLIVLRMPPTHRHMSRVMGVGPITRSSQRNSRNNKCPQSNVDDIIIAGGNAISTCFFPSSFFCFHSGTHTPNIRWLLMDCDCFHGCQRIPAQHATFP